MPTTRAAAVLDRGEVEACGILVAVSGGVDSSVLLHVLCELAPSRRLSLSVAHVNHGLRGAEADADQAAVAALAASLGLPFVTRKVSPEALRRGVSSRERPTRQEAARRVRYAALREMAEERAARWLAVGHNADDQVETVLLRLLRGCGPDALAGMSEVARGRRILRPLLAVTRQEICASACALGLIWREDRSNQNLRYTRNRLRQRWLPGLAREFNPGLLRAIGRLADAQRKDAEWIETLVAREAAVRIRAEPGGLCIDRAGWKALPDALAWRLLRRAWIELEGGREVSREHLRRMHALLAEGRSGTSIELPRGLTLSCRTADALLRAGR